MPETEHLATCLSLLGAGAGLFLAIQNETSLLLNAILTLGGAVLGLATSIFVLRQCKFKPRGFRNNWKKYPVTGNIRDRFIASGSKKTVFPDDIDYIIAGSGIGGLYCGALLARTGRKVVVFEQHDVAGGCMHTFKEHGVEFDTGIHYVGRVDKYKPLMDLLSLPDKKVDWARMGTEENGFAYDRIVVGETEHYYRAGKEVFRNDLTSRFPHQTEAIDKYMDYCNKVNRSADMWFFGKLFPVWIQKLTNKYMASYYVKHASMNTEHVIRQLCGVTDETLYSILIGQFGNYGMLPGSASFFIHAGIVSHYTGGGFYPVGGPAKWTEALVSTIELAGGRVLVNAPVKGVIVEGGRAVGVKVGKKDVEVRAKSGVVSSVGASAGLRLLESSGLERDGKLGSWAKAIRESAVPDSVSHMSCFITIDGNSDELELSSTNQWILPLGDHKTVEDAVTHYYEHGIDNTPEIMMFMGFPSKKDPTFHERHEKACCVVVTEAQGSWFEKWMDVPPNKRKRDPEYMALKKKWQDRILACLYKYFPKCEGKVDESKVFIGSPLTNVHYLCRLGSYGLEPSMTRFSSPAMASLRPKEDGVPGLFHTGEDVATAGWAGALTAGMMTAMAMLDYGFFDLVCVKRNIVEDLILLPPLSYADDDVSNANNANNTHDKKND